jgi:uncharacterized membrane protein
MSSASDRREPERRGPGLRFALIAAAFAAYPAAAWWAADHGGLAGQVALWLGALPQVFCYLALLWLFGRTLRRDREALITRLARAVHGTLPPEIERYTRNVTVFWCAFFAAMALVSVVLLAFVSTEAWLFFANVLNLPLLAAAFVGEYAWRLLRFPGFSHLSLSGTVRAFRSFRQSISGE